MAVGERSRRRIENRLHADRPGAAELEYVRLHAVSSANHRDRGRFEELRSGSPTSNV